MRPVMAVSLIAACVFSGPAGLPAWGATAQPPMPAEAAGPVTAEPARSPEAGTPAPSTPRPANVKQWLESQPRAKKGAILGALKGAAIGALLAGARGQNIARGAIVGGVAGGLVGFLLGKIQDRVYAGRDRAVELARYDPSQGYVIRVEEMSFEPATAKPGETATLSVRYLVIGPDPNERITVNCFRGIKYQEEYVMGNGPSAFVVPQGGGIVATSARITIPAKAPAGTYAVEAMFEDSQGRFQQRRTTPLYIVS